MSFRCQNTPLWDSNAIQSQNTKQTHLCPIPHRLGHAHQVWAGVKEMGMHTLHPRNVNAGALNVPGQIAEWSIILLLRISSESYKAVLR